MNKGTITIKETTNSFQIFKSKDSSSMLLFEINRDLAELNETDTQSIDSLLKWMKGKFVVEGGGLWQKFMIEYNVRGRKSAEAMSKMTKFNLREETTKTITPLDIDTDAGLMFLFGELVHLEAYREELLFQATRAYMDFAGLTALNPLIVLARAEVKFGGGCTHASGSKRKRFVQGLSNVLEMALGDYRYISTTKPYGTNIDPQVFHLLLGTKCEEKNLCSCVSE
jgi:hypothetical protein